MENISRGPTFGDFVTIRTEASMQDITVARLLLNVMYCVRVSLWTVLRNTKEKGVVGNLCISLVMPVNQQLEMLAFR
jgi:hypothetical protein